MIVFVMSECLLLDLKLIERRALLVREIKGSTKTNMPYGKSATCSAQLPE